MATFSVILLTAAPAGLAAEAGGAFLKIDNRECLLRSVELFLNRDAIKQIHLVVADDKMEEARRKYAAHLGFSGVKLIGASAKWADQLAAAAEKISAECSHVIVHDAARPIVPFNDIDAILHAADEDSKNPKGPAAPRKTVALATPVRNPLVSVDEGGDPLAFHLPSEFMQIVTPWVYAKEVFLKLAKEHLEIHPTELKLIKGSPLNIRVGVASDAAMAKSLINMLPKPKMKASENPFEEAQW